MPADPGNTGWDGGEREADANLADMPLDGGVVAKKPNWGCLVRCELGEFEESRDACGRRKFREPYLLRLRVRTRWRDQICPGDALQRGLERAWIVEVTQDNRG
jgi:hypothetical protein